VGRLRSSRVASAAVSAAFGTIIWLVLDPAAKIDSGEGWNWAALLPLMVAGAVALSALFPDVARFIGVGMVVPQAVIVALYEHGDDGLGVIGVPLLAAIGFCLSGLAHVAGPWLTSRLRI